MRQLLKNTFTLALALVFTAGLAFGQNNNTSTINQAQNGNQATSNQTGSGGTAFIDQQGVSNLAEIDQAGSGNVARIVGQTGFGNTATSKQDAATRNSRIDINQQGDGFTKPGVTAKQLGQRGSNIRVLARRTGVGGDVDVTQENGRQNRINVDLFGNEYTVDIDQVNGDFNQAFVTQNNGAGLIDPTNSEVEVLQEGSHNVSRTTQTGTDHGTRLRSIGDRNTVNQSQDGNGHVSALELQGDGNTFRTTQKGSDQALFVNADGSGPGLNAGLGNVDRNTFSAKQTGAGHRIGGSIDGVGNRITLNQSGSGNEILGGSTSRFDAKGFQVRGDQNTLTISQSGSTLSATALIDGSGNTAAINQTGSSNTASVTVQ